MSASGSKRTGVSPLGEVATRQLDRMTLHESPPPSLAARFNLDDLASSAMSAGSESSRQSQDSIRSLPEGYKDPQGSLLRFIEHLCSSEHADTEPNLVATGYELEALLAIYGSESVKLSISSRPSSYHPDHLPADNVPSSIEEEVGYVVGDRIRYEVILPVWEQGEVLDGVSADAMPEKAPNMRVMVSLSPMYPNTAAPQLQLLGRYLGNFAIDAGLFGDITRTYISSSGVTFVSGDVCVFEGLTHVQSLAKKWYAARLSSGLEGEKQRAADRTTTTTSSQPASGTDFAARQLASLDLGDEASGSESETPRPPGPKTTFSYGQDAQNGEDRLPEGLEIVSSEPIVERKSSFQGHAVRVTSEKQVPLVIHELLSDRKIAKAAHPAIFAYRIAKDVGGAAGKVISSDCDDDGETAAGGRLAHLLEILELENVLVVVSRWYGGTLLGPDRFKLINQAARDALEKAGFLDDDKPETGKNNRRRK